MNVEYKINAGSVSMDGLQIFVTYTAKDDEDNVLASFEKAYIVSSGNKTDVDALIDEDRKRLQKTFELKQKLEER